jgi:hypothetical protein
MKEHFGTRQPIMSADDVKRTLARSAVAGFRLERWTVLIE